MSSKTVTDTTQKKTKSTIKSSEYILYSVNGYYRLNTYTIPEPVATINSLICTHLKYMPTNQIGQVFAMPRESHTWHEIEDWSMKLDDQSVYCVVQPHEHEITLSSETNGEIILTRQFPCTAHDLVLDLRRMGITQKRIEICKSWSSSETPYIMQPDEWVPMIFRDPSYTYKLCDDEVSTPLVDKSSDADTSVEIEDSTSVDESSNQDDSDGKLDLKVQHCYRCEENGATLHYVQSAKEWWISDHIGAENHRRHGYCMIKSNNSAHPPKTPEKYKIWVKNPTKWGHVSSFNIEFIGEPGHEDLKLMLDKTELRKEFPYFDGNCRKLNGLFVRTPSVNTSNSSIASHASDSTSAKAEADDAVPGAHYATQLKEICQRFKKKSLMILNGEKVTIERGDIVDFALSIAMLREMHDLVKDLKSIR